jgi:hypothetical protein
LRGLPLKALVLGTSNSILKDGWVAGFQSTCPTLELENRSVGASPGIQFSLEAGTPFSDYDLVFFDSVPNDQEFASLQLPCAHRTVAIWPDILYELCSTISANSRLIVLGFCHRGFVTSHSAVYSARKRMAQLLGVQFVDIGSIVYRLHSEQGYPLSALYGDHPAHIAYWLAFEIGCQLGRILTEQPSAVRRRSMNTSYAQNFHTLPATRICDNVKTVGNSHVTLRTVRLHESYELNLPGTAHCLGLSLNAADTHCCLRWVSSARETIPDYLCYYPSKHEQVVKIFLPLLWEGPINAIQILRKASPNKFRTMFSGEDFDESEMARMSLSAISFWSGQTKLDWRASETSCDTSLSLSKLVFQRLRLASTGT